MSFYKPDVYIEGQTVHKSNKSLVKQCYHKHHGLTEGIFSVYYVNEVGALHHMKDFVNQDNAMVMANNLNEGRIHSLES